MKILVELDYDPNVNQWSATAPQINHVSSFGPTEDIAMERLKEAIELYLEFDLSELAQNESLNQADGKSFKRALAI
jgi:predicted RNase H-like HicB family nuclease